MELARTLFRPVTAYAWPPVVALSRRAILSLLSQITVGELVIHDAGTNITTVCGSIEAKSTDAKRQEKLNKSGRRDGPPRTVLRVQHDVFWVRLLLFADMVRSSGPRNAIIWRC